MVKHTTTSKYLAKQQFFKVWSCNSHIKAVTSPKFPGKNYLYMHCQNMVWYNSSIIKYLSAIVLQGMVLQLLYKSSLTSFLVKMTSITQQVNNLIPLSTIVLRDMVLQLLASSAEMHLDKSNTIVGRLLCVLYRQETHGLDTAQYVNGRHSS